MINVDEWCEMEENISKNTTLFYRTKGGEVVHKAGCPILKRAKKKYPWSWAENNGLTDEDKMLQYLSDNAYRIKPCRTCFNLKNKGVMR